MDITSPPALLPRYGGLELLRLTAVVLVTAQHALTLINNEHWTTAYHLNIGQLGVALFFGIAGFLAGNTDRRPIDWLFQRFLRLLPAYWLTMVFCFSLAWATDYKRFDAYQFISQMAGTGLFTHRRTLINVPTWFFSLLLVGYLALFCGKFVRKPALVGFLLAAATAFYTAFTGFAWPWFHLITFFSTSACAPKFHPRLSSLCLAIASIVFLSMSSLSVVFLYSGMTVLCIGIALRISRVPRIVLCAAEYSYEYYLVHGVFLLGTTKALPNHPVIAIALGVCSAAVAAICLRQFVNWAAFRVSTPKMQQYFRMVSAKPLIQSSPELDRCVES